MVDDGLDDSWGVDSAEQAAKDCSVNGGSRVVVGIIVSFGLSDRSNTGAIHGTVSVATGYCPVDRLWSFT